MQVGLAEAPSPVARYLDEVDRELADVPAAERERLLTLARAQVDLALELAHTSEEEADQARRAIATIGAPSALAQALRSEVPAITRTTAGHLTACRCCHREVSTEAPTCPHCGAPFPARAAWQGWGYEWKSKQTLFGWPLVHVAWGKDAQGKFRVAKGIIAVGQVGVGGIVIAQAGAAAVFGLGQAVIAPIAIGQVAVGLIAIGQLALGALFGLGMLATGLKAIGVAELARWFRSG